MPEDPLSRLEKLVERICARPVEADYDDVRRLVEGYGWVRANEKGSHVTYRKAGERPLVIIKAGGRRVKRVYLDRLIERLELDC